ncbi:hypothetical protein CANTEDRAFT_110516 [Yamadazyma tenuis ATCC 10573]|uniref:Septin-type G domain-containing protein n=2 Tax=Candida tenuis TaxID=2315449 RepID=G3BEA3_CANTC|nr:uncharacterized protein CANTEDRAFT_110516 [Yamadazyma tenuis ATCC 10573]EGV60501.1 hypothetical protein CANTEDRAFT_110516 [Yamadazyma tenuis ATCC 10573]
MLDPKHEYEKEINVFTSYHDSERSVNQVTNAAEVGLSLLPTQIERHSQRKGGHFNLMVAGTVGTGKSSFINTLFASELVPDKSGFSSTYLDKGEYQLVEQGFPLSLRIIETSGMGQNIDNNGCWIPISNYIDEQFSTYLFKDQQPDRSKKIDTRIHCCLYFLPPSLRSISPLDIETMKALCSRVNLVPIIGKSDCLSVEELARYKSGSKNLFQVHNIRICDFFTDEEATSIIQETMPFSSISSKDILEKDGGNWARGRSYPWGYFAEIEDSSHCDFSCIRKMLMSDFMLEFIDSTEKHYEQYRNQFLTTNLAVKDETLLSADGFNQLKAYSKLKYADYDNTQRADSVFKYRESVLKNKFNVEIENQEKRFRIWKKALVEKQVELNKDIEDMHSQLLYLQETITIHEEGVDSNSIAKHFSWEIDTFDFLS